MLPGGIFMGQSITLPAVLVRCVHMGDANLDGVVADFNAGWMARFNEELVNASVMLAGEGLGPSRMARTLRWGEAGKPVVVLTHEPPADWPADTPFTFVTEGIEEALRRAKEAAGSKDVRLGGGVETIRQYLRARLVDEMHLAISPVVLGSGEHLLAGLDLLALGYQVAEHATSEAAMHVVLKRTETRRA